MQIETRQAIPIQSRPVKSRPAKSRLGLALSLLFASFNGAHAQAPGTTHIPRAQRLVENEVERHPGTDVIAMHVTKPGDTRTAILASTLIKSIGKASDEDDIAVGVTGKPFAEPMPEKARYEVLVPLLTRTGQRIGSLGVAFPWHTGESTADFMARATAIRDDLQPDIVSLDDLVVPEERIVKPHTFAQRLVDEALAAHPEIVILVIRATPPGGTVPIVVGSNIGRYGSPAGKDDSRIIATGVTGTETDVEKHRYEVEPALRDSKGNILGSLSVVFRYKPGDDTQAMQKTASQVHAAMTAQLPDNAALFR